VQHVEKTTKWTKSNGRGCTYIPIFPSKPKIQNVLIKHVPQQLLVSLLLPRFSSLKYSFCVLDFLLKILQPQNTKSIHAKNYYKDYYLLLHNYLLSPLHLWIYIRRLSMWPQRLFISLKFVTWLCYILRFCCKVLL
jgi:hypothetical protein